MVQQRQKEEQGRIELMVQLDQATDSPTRKQIQQKLQEQEQHIADIQNEQQQLMELTIASSETASEIIRLQQNVLLAGGGSGGNNKQLQLPQPQSTSLAIASASTNANTTHVSPSSENDCGNMGLQNDENNKNNSNHHNCGGKTQHQGRQQQQLGKPSLPSSSTSSSSTLVVRECSNNNGTTIHKRALKPATKVPYMATTSDDHSDRSITGRRDNTFSVLSDFFLDLCGV